MAIVIVGELSLLVLAWSGSGGEATHWLWIALTIQIIVNAVIYLNLAGIAGVWLVGFIGGLISPPTAVASGTALAEQFIRFMAGLGHAVALVMVSLIWLEPSLLECLGIVAVLTLFGFHALTFPRASRFAEWISLGILVVVITALLYSSIPPLYRQVILGQPYVSDRAERAAAEGAAAMAENEEKYREAANERITKVIAEKNIRSLDELDTLAAKGEINKEDLRIYKETISGNSQRTLPNGIKSAAGSVGQGLAGDNRGLWIAGIMLAALVLLIFLGRKSKALPYLIGIPLVLLVVGLIALLLLNEELAVKLIDGRTSQEITYTAEFGTGKQIPLEPGRWEFEVRSIPGEQQWFRFACSDVGSGTGDLTVPSSGELTVNGIPEGKPFSSTGTVSMALSHYNNRPECKVSIPGTVQVTLSPKILPW
mgnify:CR=1 FL=1